MGATLNHVLSNPNDAADELDELRERVAEMQYEAGMYQSLYELAQTKSNDAYERGFCAGYDVSKMQGTPAEGLLSIASELEAFHDCADGDVQSGNGHFRLECVSESEQQRLNLRAVLRDAAKALRLVAGKVAAPSPS